nr:Ppx/GppA phosphatase family protein [Desulfuromonas sp. CSMB_57]
MEHSVVGNIQLPEPLVTPAQQRLAAIDIGTNSIRCIVVEVDEAGRFKTLDDEKATVRLGEGLTGSGEISLQAWQRAEAALQRMRMIAAGHGAEIIEAVATSAVRKARNGQAFIAAMAKATGIRIDVISGEEEAELAVLSARNNFVLENQRCGLVDIGGGSLEIIVTADGLIENICSLELGALVLTERFTAGDPVSEKDLKALRQHVHATLKKNLDEEDFDIQCLIGSGGTMTTIAGMVMAMRNEQFSSLHGYEVLRSEVVHLLAMLRRKTLKERKSLPGLSADRADIILAGVATVDEVMRYFGVNLLRINAVGIRQGLILKSLEKHGLGAAQAAAQNSMASVLAFARHCHVNERHARQVARLALLLFDTLAPRFGLTHRGRQLLEAAAFLHDVGYFINYEKHHQHSYHLIRHANLFGFSPLEREIIANLARYHRKKTPRKKHENFALLPTAIQPQVKQLAAILRLADGLDRRRNQAVQAMDCRLTDNRLDITLDAHEVLTVEMHCAEDRSDLLAEAFGLRVSLQGRICTTGQNLVAAD